MSVSPVFQSVQNHRPNLVSACCCTYIYSHRPPVDFHNNIYTTPEFAPSMRRDLRSAMLDASIPPPTSSNKPPHTSGTISAVIATVVPLLAFIYFAALFGLYRYARRHPRPVNKTSGVRLQRYGPGARHANLLFPSTHAFPAVYVFMVCSSLAEVCTIRSSAIFSFI